ncbi:interferon-induced very large GTPase 1-like [Lampetra fluviatilis]
MHADSARSFTGGAPGYIYAASYMGAEEYKGGSWNVVCARAPAPDHTTVLLTSAYRPLVKVTKPVIKRICVWPEGSSEELQDCFSTTDWNMFKKAATYNNTVDLQEYTETVTSYMRKCMEDVTVTRTISIRANQKPWLTGEVHRLLRARNAAFKAGEEMGLKTARANLSRGIRLAKRQYSRRIADRFNDSRDTRNLWRGMQTITDYKPFPQTCDSSTSLLNQLKDFFARFEADNSTPAQKTPPPPGDQVLTLSPDSVRRSLRRTNPSKAQGPDNIPGRVLRDCAEELTDVFTDIFNTSLRQVVVPTCLKATTIIPVPKKSSPSCHNDYRPVALTPILMKCFERLVLQHIKSVLPPALDPFQFAYRSNRSTDDAISATLHSALTHLETKYSYVRMLFIDFSSAFNTIIPQQLIHKLDHLGLNTSLCNWLLDFLIGRPQAVRVGSNTSSTITLNTGVPQGCVLSPLLFTLLTHDCTPSFSSNLFIKFADDTTVVGAIKNGDETNYRSEVSRLATWCKDNNLHLNVEKTKEIVVDFRRVHTQHTPLTINGAAVERVRCTKFLGVHISEDLSWSHNTASLAKKAQQRLYFLRKLRRAGAPPPIMHTFYRGTVESILTSCITVWYGTCTVSCRKTLQRITRSTEHELAFDYLQKLILVDYRARYVGLPDENTNNETTHNDNSNIAKLNNFSDPVLAHGHPNFDDFFCDVYLSSRDEPMTDTRNRIHPMDFQMAIFHCGDNFVRQYIYTKLSFCQFALPLLVPNPCNSEIEFPIWAFRQIKKSWKSRAASTETQQTNLCAIVDADTPLVSFIRFGESLTSKSQMLNSLLGKQKNDVFFHRHCKGSSKNGLLMEGVAEIAWYCPGGRNEDVFNDCIAFTNLHGDAREHKKQVQFLLEISTVNVIIMSDCDRNDEAKRILELCLSSAKPLLCLCADKEIIWGGNSRTKVKIAVKNRNEAELMDELKSTLKYMLANSTQPVKIDVCSDIARQHGFSVDEDDEQCKQGKSMADKLLSLLKEKPLSAMKDTFMPLQGKLWNDWCKKDKELNRLRVEGDQSVEQCRAKIEMEKQSIREAQHHKAFPFNYVMETLIDILQLQADTVKKYFLHWLKIYLDNLSAGELIKSKKEKQERLLTLNLAQKLQKISGKRDASSFGIHHLFREIGQIYEVSQTSHGADKRTAALPGIAADLMLSGFPLELMDGDASHVPLSWISSVLNKVSEKVGHRKLFVLSILGLQSSGKSTLLNAMFGLQFPVGAGRCTRGVYMQLVKLEEELTTELGCDFLLIVDTEGLRAPELSNATPAHDNELATFVIGLGNVTVINIFGENPSEMQDILQIAVQAFLRMKRVKLSPSCVFVHQNVGCVTAQDNNEDARGSLQEKLDKMTRMAAELEQCDVESFDQVIRFDADSHVRYFAHLWEGNPPMAPPNTVYCDNVKELKEMLMIIAEREHNVLKISEFGARIQDLWSALLTENFVFSFKNTLEIAAYSKLEQMYGKWTWSLRSVLIQEENNQYNIINNTTRTSVRSVGVQQGQADRGV